MYGRIITEGMFGIRPVGFRSFELTPRLPGEWNEMALRRVHAFGSDFDIEVRRVKQGQLQVKVLCNGKVQTKTLKEGATVRIGLK